MYYKEEGATYHIYDSGHRITSEPMTEEQINLLFKGVDNLTDKGFTVVRVDYTEVL